MFPRLVIIIVILVATVIMFDQNFQFMSTSLNKTARFLFKALLRLPLCPHLIFTLSQSAPADRDIYEQMAYSVSALKLENCKILLYSPARRQTQECFLKPQIKVVSILIGCNISRNSDAMVDLFPTHVIL